MLFYFVPFLTLCASVTSLSVGNATPKPKHPKHTSSDVVNDNKNIKATSDYVQYSFKDDGDSVCILFKADAILEVHFKSPIGNDKDDALFSEKADVSGECNDDDGLLGIAWSGYQFNFNFKKTPGGERWYMKQIELIVDPTILKGYHEIKDKLGKTFTLYNTQMLFLTPVGSSYSCDNTNLSLYMPPGESNPTEMEGLLLLRKFQVQPFMYKGNDFGPAFDCSVQATYRDETAPIAVGSTLAVAVLATITGYAIYRHFKVKKVQYNTME